MIPYGVGALHLLLFTVLFWKVRGSFFGGDTGEFVAIANAIRSGTLISHPGYGKPLGYPILLALAAMFPGSLTVNALLFNAVFYLLTIAVVGRIARLLTGSSAMARIAQTGFALVPNTAAWANLVLSETLAMVLLVSSFWVYLQVERAEDRARWIRQLMVLGILLGMLGLTRSEYLLLLPIATMLLGVRLLSRGLTRRALLGMILVWAGSVPLLMWQPIVSSAPGRISLIPQKQSGFLALWGSQYDLEFTQLRFHRLADILYEVGESPTLESAIVQAKLRTLTSSEAGEDPIDEARLNQASRDIERFRELVGREGYRPLDAYRALALESLAQHPRRYVSRAFKRLLLFMTAVELDWPSRHPAHWMYTVVLRPLSTLAYLWLGFLLVVHRAYPRGQVIALTLWTSFPIVAHSVFILEQRFAYPSVPLLCIVWALAIHAVLEGRTQRAVARLGRAMPVVS